MKTLIESKQLSSRLSVEWILSRLQLELYFIFVILHKTTNKKKHFPNPM